MERSRWAEAQAGWAIDTAGTVTRLSASEWSAAARKCFPPWSKVPRASDPREAEDNDRHLAIALSSLVRDDHAAVWHLDRVLAGGSKVPALWIERADCHRRLGHAQLALDDLERVLALDPRRLAEWGFVFTVLRDLPENDAVKDFESRAVSRWLATTGEVLEASGPVLIELAARRGADQRWEQAAALSASRTYFRGVGLCGLQLPERKVRDRLAAKGRPGRVSGVSGPAIRCASPQETGT